MPGQKAPVGKSVIAGYDPLLRQEIVESEKIQADFLKWKLIAAATLGSLSLGVAFKDAAAESVKLLICLVPFLCIYVDLINIHLMIRIVTIGSFLKAMGNPYEKFVFNIRIKSVNPFVFETAALFGSSLIFNVLVLVLGLELPEGTGGWPARYLTAYKVAGLIGSAGTISIWYLYKGRERSVRHHADDFARSLSIE